MFVIFIIYFTLFVTKKHFVTGECNLDNSNLNQTLVLVKCTKINTRSESYRVGTILTNNFILTASVLPSQGVACVMTYNINGDRGEQTTESSSIRSYLLDSNTYPHASPQLQLLGVTTPINFELPGPIPNIILAKTIKLTEYGPEMHDNAILHTIRKIGNKYDVVQMKVTFARRSDCKAENPYLHPHVFCITIVNKGCDGCNNVMPGSALVQYDDLIGIVSERVKCNPSKMILCANVYKIRKWIKSFMRNSRAWGPLWNDTFLLNLQLC